MSFRRDRRAAKLIGVDGKSRWRKEARDTAADLNLILAAKLARSEPRDDDLEPAPERPQSAPIPS